jgi:hypothetical protein
VGALLVAVAVAVGHSSPQITTLPLPVDGSVTPGAGAGATPAPTVAAPLTAGPSTADAQAHLPPMVGYLAAAVFVLGAAVAVAVAVAHLMRDGAARRAPAQPPRAARTGTGKDRSAQVLAAVDAGLADLAAASSDPRGAVIACWVRLERLAAELGTARHRGDAPTEFVVRLLVAHQVSQVVLTDLTEVYLAARFASHPVDETDRTAAVNALAHLRAELVGVGSGRSGVPA